jgi:hypothetical protein
MLAEKPVTSDAIDASVANTYGEFDFTALFYADSCSISSSEL